MNLLINAGMLCFGEVNAPRNVLEKKYLKAFEEVRTLGWDISKAPLVCDYPDYKDVKEAVAFLEGKKI